MILTVIIITTRAFQQKMMMNVIMQDKTTTAAKIGSCRTHAFGLRSTSLVFQVWLALKKQTFWIRGVVFLWKDATNSAKTQKHDAFIANSPSYFFHTHLSLLWVF